MFAVPGFARRSSEVRWPRDSRGGSLHGEPIICAPDCSLNGVPDGALGSSIHGTLGGGFGWFVSVCSYSGDLVGAA